MLLIFVAGPCFEEISGDRVSAVAELLSLVRSPVHPLSFSASTSAAPTRAAARSLLFSSLIRPPNIPLFCRLHCHALRAQPPRASHPSWPAPSALPACPRRRLRQRVQLRLHRDRQVLCPPPCPSRALVVYRVDLDITASVGLPPAPAHRPGHRVHQRRRRGPSLALEHTLFDSSSFALRVAAPQLLQRAQLLLHERRGQRADQPSAPA